MCPLERKPFLCDDHQIISSSRVNYNNDKNNNDKPKFVRRQRAFIGEESSSVDDDPDAVISSPFDFNSNDQHQLFVRRQHAFRGEESSTVDEDRLDRVLSRPINNDLFVSRQPAFAGESLSSSLEVPDDDQATQSPFDMFNGSSSPENNHNLPSTSSEEAQKARQELNRMLLKGARKVAL